MSSPLLILGTGQRCGSTLMQRLLSSHPDAFIWGEHGGHLLPMLEAVENLTVYSNKIGSYGREDFAESGYQAFIANMTPEPAHIEQAFKTFVEALGSTSEPAVGRRVWGFKEVRYDLDFATRMHRFLPGLSVIFIIRDPRDILSSLDEWEGKGWPRARTQEAIDNWLRIAASFLETPAIPVLSVRYEDYVADPAATARQVGEFAGLDPEQFDLSVFGRKIHTHGGEGERKLRSWDELPADLQALLDVEAIRTTAAAYGYELSGTGHGKLP